MKIRPGEDDLITVSVDVGSGANIGKNSRRSGKMVIFEKPLFMIQAICQ